jgi:hypothetical protein
MKRVPLALALALTVVPPCFAQEVWTEPGGRFSLVLSDWTALPTEQAAQAGNMLVITRTDTLGDHRVRVCALSQRRPHPDEGQDTANDYLDRITAADISANVGKPVEDVVHGRIGNIATLDYSVRLNGSEMRTRNFVLAGNGQMVVFDITCGAPPPMTADEAASITAVLNSLEIRPVELPTH